MATSRFGRHSNQRDFDSVSASSDSQFTENDEELTFFESCLECDDDALYDLIQNGTTYEQVNEQDKSGRVSRITLFSGADLECAPPARAPCSSLYVKQ